MPEEALDTDYTPEAYDATPYQYQAPGRPANDNAETPERNRINNTTAILLIGTAVLFDGLQFLVVWIPVIDIIVDWFLAILATTIFAIWFGLLGVSYFSGKQAATKALTVLGSVVVELIPIVDALPAITAGVVLIILQVRIEDKVYNKENAQKALALARYARGKATQTVARAAAVRSGGLARTALSVGKYFI